MVLYVGKWNIRPEKAGEYAKWAKSAMARMFSVPGLVEFRGYRPATGPHEIAATYEFADMSAWANWRYSDDVLKLWQEARLYCGDMSFELWGPSPITPKPMRREK